MNHARTWAEVSAPCLRRCSWEMTQLTVRMDGKALFFKTIAVRQQELYSHYQPVPTRLTLAQAADILRKDTAS